MSAASATTTRGEHAQQTNRVQESRLTTTKSNLKYLFDPKKNASHQPSQFRTRALLRSLRYITIFVFWRLVRYAKYAAVGALTAALATTAVGSVISGVGFVVAPTGIVGGAVMGVVWGVGKLGWSRVWRGAKNKKERSDGEGDARRDEREDAEGLDDLGRGERRVGEVRTPAGTRVEPW
ncbi:hypothetical protein CERZMDRAFT_100075 [Cercospora zeae-maydis SCOH1-5]|uniref:Uncharacterized protein n=1 Tax=Cercospora zeae-maydis SCOH1-5 TaxID=717836 RepID=A0A6A6F805_9PEZI|nr:hypothetical protein CERZMDRAFT_100075 [Cercospora zeae-maydis SCOH1-5]